MGGMSSSPAFSQSSRALSNRGTPCQPDRKGRDWASQASIEHADDRTYRGLAIALIPKFCDKVTVRYVCFGDLQIPAFIGLLRPRDWT